MSLTWEHAFVANHRFQHTLKPCSCAGHKAQNDKIQQAQQRRASLHAEAQQKNCSALRRKEEKQATFVGELNKAAVDSANGYYIQAMWLLIQLLIILDPASLANSKKPGTCPVHHGKFPYDQVTPEAGDDGDLTCSFHDMLCMCQVKYKTKEGWLNDAKDDLMKSCLYHIDEAIRQNGCGKLYFVYISLKIQGARKLVGRWREQQATGFSPGSSVVEDLRKHFKAAADQLLEKGLKIPLKKEEDSSSPSSGEDIGDQADSDDDSSQDGSSPGSVHPTDSLLANKGVTAQAANAEVVSISAPDSNAPGVAARRPSATKANTSTANRKKADVTKKPQQPAAAASAYTKATSNQFTNNAANAPVTSTASRNTKGVGRSKRQPGKAAAASNPVSIPAPAPDGASAQAASSLKNKLANEKLRQAKDKLIKAHAARLKFIDDDRLFCEYLQHTQLLPLPTWEELHETAIFALSRYIKSTCQAETVGHKDAALSQIAHIILTDLYFGMADSALHTGAAYRKLHKTAKDGSKTSRATEDRKKRTLTLSSIRAHVQRLVKRLAKAQHVNSKLWRSYQKLSQAWRTVTREVDSRRVDIYMSNARELVSAMSSTIADSELEPAVQAGMLKHYAGIMNPLAALLPNPERDAKHERQAAEEVEAERKARVVADMLEALRDMDEQKAAEFEAALK